MALKSNSSSTSSSSGVESINMRSNHRVESINMRSNNPLVRAFDRKGKGYLSSLHRSFSTSAVVGRDYVSMLSEDDDPSAMTVEFLRARLQSQRAEYKAEKQRARILARKVVELERKLQMEIHLRKRAENVSSVVKDEINEDESTTEEVIAPPNEAEQQQDQKEQNENENENENESSRISLSSSEGSDEIVSSKVSSSPLIMPERRRWGSKDMKKKVAHMRSPSDNFNSSSYSSAAAGFMEPEGSEATTLTTKSMVPDTISRSREMRDPPAECREVRRVIPAGKHYYYSPPKPKLGRTDTEKMLEEARALHRHKHQELTALLQYFRNCHSPQTEFVAQGGRRAVVGMGANHKSRATKTVSNLSDESREIRCVPTTNNETLLGTMMKKAAEAGYYEVPPSPIKTSNKESKAMDPALMMMRRRSNEQDELEMIMMMSSKPPWPEMLSK